MQNRVVTKLQEVMFNGCEGKLEGKFMAGEEKNAPAALILHPHPLHGGTMNNKVIYNAFYSMSQCGFSVLRFNFRGVGRSEGSFDHGEGELTDAALALDWLQSVAPEASSYWLVGFSFGAWIGMKLLMRRPEINAFISISPPAHSYDFSFLSPCPTPGLIIQGSKDQTVPEGAVFSLYDKLRKQKNSNIEYVSINGADHFFKGYMDDLNNAMKSYVQPKISSDDNQQKVKKNRRKKSIMDVIGE